MLCCGGGYESGRYSKPFIRMVSGRSHAVTERGYEFVRGQGDGAEDAAMYGVIALHWVS